MRLYQMADAVRYEMMNTEELRETFLLEGLLRTRRDRIRLCRLSTAPSSAPPFPSAKSSSSETEPEPAP